MKKRLSAYWWCQIGGWSAYILVVSEAYLSMGYSISGFFPLMLLHGISGIFITHLMRLFMIRTGALQLPVLRQIIYMFLITFFFSFFHALISFWLAEALHWGDELRNLYVAKNKTEWYSTFSLFKSDCFFLGIWNLIYLSAYYIEKNRRDQIEKIRLENELQIQRLQSEKQHTELEMQALRAQMNPHFIFNSLNSINRFILQNNKAQASEYLTKFSRLVRLILQNSQEALITLESELESLQLYLELEAVRFDHHFDYKITVEDNLDISVIKVPSLILQPYTENAIWHGLMHKEEKGQLDIEVSQEGDLLYFKVTDNGIGRKQAAALASKSATKHKSLGLKITAHRIAMIQQTNSQKSSVTVNDLVEPDGTAVGTEVVIKMPLLYD